MLLFVQTLLSVDSIINFIHFSLCLLLQMRRQKKARQKTLAMEEPPFVFCVALLWRSLEVCLMIVCCEKVLVVEELNARKETKYQAVRLVQGEL